MAAIPWLHWVPILLLTAAPARAGTPGRGLAAGDGCIAAQVLRVSARPKGGRKQDIPAGAQVRVLRTSKGVAEISAGDKHGYVPARRLARFCKAAPSAPAAEGAGSTPAGSEAAKIPGGPVGQQTPVPGSTAAPAATGASDAQPVPASAASLLGSAEGAEVATSAPTSSVASDAGATTPAPIAGARKEPEAVREGGDSPGPDKIKVAVMDLRADAGVGRDMGQSLTAVVPQTLDELGPFKSISNQEIQSMLQLEKLKDAVGCDDVSCLAEIGGALGADYMVTGAVLLAGDTYWIQLQLSDIGAAKVTGRVSRQYTGKPAGLMDEMRIATKQLVRDILAKNSGRLLVRVTEEGATVRLDGNIVGTSPLAPMTVGSGMHTLAVEHEGFIRFARDIEVRPGRDTAIDALLVPSEEFRRAYVGHAQWVRTLAYVSAGIGVLGLGGAGALYVVSHDRAATLSSDVAAYNAQTTPDPTLYDQLVSRRTTVARLDAATVVAGAVGLAGIAAGVSLWATGDDPHRFDARPGAGGSEPAVTLQVGQTAGGGWLALAGTF